MFVLIDFTDEAHTEVSHVAGPFETEEEADQWDESTGQRSGMHIIVPIHGPEKAIKRAIDRAV